jgi:hypothetical protein
MVPGGRGGERVRRLRADASRFLASVQVGVTFAGFFGSAWARFPPGAKEERNRRVQVRVHWGPPPKK